MNIYKVRRDETYTNDIIYIIAENARKAADQIERYHSDFRNIISIEFLAPVIMPVTPIETPIAGSEASVSKPTQKVEQALHVLPYLPFGWRWLGLGETTRQGDLRCDSSFETVYDPGEGLIIDKFTPLIRRKI